mmetsp:Transcript_89793/g.231834  ORF Transcript_89793/g.231834 Transcript_89793/m.231834 type:complete len:218 (-) Transcript_89793:640-1293(-)
MRSPRQRQVGVAPAKAITLRDHHSSSTANGSARPCLSKSSMRLVAGRGQGQCNAYRTHSAWFRNAGNDMSLGLRASNGAASLTALIHLPCSAKTALAHATLSKPSRQVSGLTPKMTTLEPTVLAIRSSTSMALGRISNASATVAQMDSSKSLRLRRTTERSRSSRSEKGGKNLSGWKTSCMDEAPPAPADATVWASVTGSTPVCTQPCPLGVATCCR